MAAIFQHGRRGLHRNTIFQRILRMAADSPHFYRGMHFSIYKADLTKWNWYEAI